MSDHEDTPSTQIGGINLSRLDKTDISAQTITSHVEAGGHIAGRDVVIYNYYYQAQTVTAPAPPGDTAPLDDLPNPYRGLYHFGPADAPFFFGRERYTELLVERVQTPDRRLLAVVGASGSGKSSVVLAGLTPRLQASGGWLFTHFRPGNEPLLALAHALTPLYTPELDATDQLVQARKLAGHFQDGSLPLSDVVARIEARQPQARLLLIADQFEELYTLCPDEAARRRFLDLLLAQLGQPTGRLTLVLTLRADFMGHALAYRPLAEALQDADLKLGPMDRPEQERAIVQPAARYQVSFESGLVERILAEVGDEPGRLPLLEFALTLLWERRQGRQLSHAAYEAVGGVEGALANHADRQFAGLTAEAQLQARRILVQLVHPGHGTEDTRRLATVAELGEARWPLVKQLADARLVVTGRSTGQQETAEVIHEALIRRWQTLQGWLEEDRAFRVWQDRLRAARDQWQESGQDSGALLRGVPLAEAGQMLAERSDEIPPAEQAFIQASQAAATAEEREKEAQRQRELEQARRLSQRAKWLIGVGVVALVLAIVAVWFGVQSAQNEANAVAQATAAYVAQQAAEAEKGRADTEAINANHAKATAQAQRDITEVELDFYQATDPAARLAELAKLFSRPDPDSQATARQLFFSLPKVDQLALLRAADERLLQVGPAVLPNLADINRTGYTDDHLQVLAESLANLPAPAGAAAALKSELEQWLACRASARDRVFEEARACYDARIKQAGNNPALWYERAGTLAALGEAQAALASLEQATVLAQTPAYATTGVLPVGEQFVTEFASSERMIEAVRRLMMVYPALASKFQVSTVEYPHLAGANLIFPAVITTAQGIPTVRVPAGRFKMGSNSGFSEEQPVHEVDLDEFYIDQFEVTNAQYLEFLQAVGYRQEGGVPWLATDQSRISQDGEKWQVAAGYANHPVMGVSWYGARAYCSWRTEQSKIENPESNIVFRLPTEAEWEKAARGTDQRTYPWGEQINCDLANYGGCVGDATPVGDYPAGVSPYGAYDLAGNVWEWVQSEYKTYPYQADDGRENLDSTDVRVLRGGSWYGDADGARASYRYITGLVSQSGYVGFRCAGSAPE